MFIIHQQNGVACWTHAQIVIRWNSTLENKCNFAIIYHYHYYHQHYCHYYCNYYYYHHYYYYITTPTITIRSEKTYYLCTIFVSIKFVGYNLKILQRHHFFNSRLVNISQ
jgi:hypothetical protein